LKLSKKPNLRHKRRLKSFPSKNNLPSQMPRLKLNRSKNLRRRLKSTKKLKRLFNRN